MVCHGSTKFNTKYFTHIQTIITKYSDDAVSSNRIPFWIASNNANERCISIEADDRNRPIRREHTNCNDFLQRKYFFCEKRTCSFFFSSL